MPAPQPRMHGLTHVPGGSDPIPGLELSPAASSFPDLIAELAATSDLLGYWRLGEGASPYLDTSGHAGGPANAIKTTAGTLHMDENIVGALPTAADDGAVKFKDFGSSADMLNAAEPVTPRFWLNNAMTVAAWLKPTAGSHPYPTTAVGAWRNDASVGNAGWRLGMNYPALTPFFQRRQIGAGVSATVTGAATPAGTWVFAAGTYDPTAGHKLYINGALVASDAGTFSGMPDFGVGVDMAQGATPPAAFNYYVGGLDEVSVWGDALTAAEIAELYAVGAKPVTPADVSGKVDRDAVEAATARLVQVKLLAGDTQPAFKIQGDGTLSWGQGGTTAPDTTLSRVGVGDLKTAGVFRAGEQIVASDLSATSKLIMGAAGPAGAAGFSIGGDTNLYRFGIGYLKTDGHQQFGGNIVVNGGTIILGAAADVTLARDPSGALKTNVAFQCESTAGIGVRQLHFGAADSGGTGYRMVRVAN